MTPDPLLDKLARFTPSAGALDPAEILFRAGRASARTPRGWKIACAGLLLATLTLIGDRLLREANPQDAKRLSIPEVGPPLVIPPVTSPAPDPGLAPNSAETASPWRLGALLHTTDPNELPRSPVLVGLSPADPPLTPRSRGEID